MLRYRSIFLSISTHVSHISTFHTELPRYDEQKTVLFQGASDTEHWKGSRHWRARDCVFGTSQEVRNRRARTAKAHLHHVRNRPVRCLFEMPATRERDTLARVFLSDQNLGRKYHAVQTFGPCRCFTARFNACRVRASRWWREGAGVATIPGKEVTAGEQTGRSNVQPDVATGSASTRSNAMRSESQYTIGEKEGRGPGDKPDASEVAPAAAK